MPYIHQPHMPYVLTQIVTPALDILDGCPVGQQEAARRTLQSQGVQILTGQRVSSLGAAEQPPSEPQVTCSPCWHRRFFILWLYPQQTGR